MFEKFTAANQNDFRTRYQGTYGFYKEPKREPMLCRLEFVDGIVTFKDKKGATYELYPDRPGDIGFEFLPPRSGFFNTDEGAVYVQRRAARQFQRGVSDRTVEMYLLRVGNEDPGRRGFGLYPVNFKSLEKVYEGKITPKDQWRNFVDGVVPSLAISQEFAINKKNVYVLSTACGTISELTKEGVTLKLEDGTLFQTEIRDAFRDVAKVEFQ